MNRRRSGSRSRRETTSANSLILASDSNVDASRLDFLSISANPKRVRRATPSLLDIDRKRFSAVQGSIDFDGMPLRCTANIKLGIVHDVDLRHEPRISGSAEPVSCKLLNKGVTVEQRNSGNVISIHLSRDDFSWLIGPAYIQASFFAHANCKATEVFRGSNPVAAVRECHRQSCASWRKRHTVSIPRARSPNPGRAPLGLSLGRIALVACS